MTELRPLEAEKMAKARLRSMAVLTAKQDMMRLYHKRFAAEGHNLRCQMEDGLDNRAITEAHAEVYDGLVGWLRNQLLEVHEELEKGK